VRVLEERALQIESYAYTGGHVAAMVETVVQTADLGVPLLAGDSLDPHSTNWTKRSHAGRPVGGGGMFHKPHPPSEEMTARREGL
jgi:hypothetical protein